MSGMSGMRAAKEIWSSTIGMWCSGPSDASRGSSGVIPMAFIRVRVIRLELVASSCCFYIELRSWCQTFLIGGNITASKHGCRLR